MTPCNCGGYAPSMNGRDPENPHMAWCAQYPEWRERKMNQLRIEIAPTEQIDKFPEGRERFLHLIGIEGALITDESLVGDFLDPTDSTRNLSLAVGYIVNLATPVWKVCRDLESA